MSHNELISRPRLSDLFNQGKHKKLIFIQAPAGYGKTTATVQWLNQTDRRFTWYSIAGSDNEIGLFLSYFVYSLGQIQDGICQTLLPLINSSEPPSTDIMLAQLINDFSCLEQQTTIVLDDFHLIQNKEIHEAMLFIIQHLPAELQIIILSRQGLPFSISNLRANGHVHELNVLDLRFTKIEIENFINNILDLSLTEENISQLERRTDGWISGLQLAAMSIRDHKEISAVIQRLSGEDQFITDYLVDEVIHHLPEDVYTFLLQTSILERFCPDLCNYILEISDSQKIIEQLEQTNSFIIPLDHKQTWYRYHHLFAELLYRRLGKQSKNQIRSLYIRASIWHEETNHINEAILYAQKSKDDARVAELLNKSIQKIILHGGREFAINILSELNLEKLRSHKNLWVYFILALLDSGAFREAQFQIDRLWGAEFDLSKLPVDKKNEINGYIECFKAAIFIHTALDAEKAIECTERALQLLDHNEYLGLSIAYGHHGSASLHLGRIDKAASSLEQAIKSSKKADYDLIYLLWFSYRAQVELHSGNLNQAKLLFDQAAEYASSRGLNMSNVFINAINGLGRIYYEWNELETALEYMLFSVRLAEFGENIDNLVLAYASYFRYLILNKEFDEAQKKLEKIKSIASVHLNPPIIHERIESFEIDLELATGSADAVMSKVKAISGRPGPDFNALHEHKWRSLANLSAHCGDIGHAVNILNDLISAAEQDNRTYSIIELKANLAIYYNQLHEPEKTIQHLRQALLLAEPQNILRTFSDLGIIMKGLLEKVLITNENELSFKDYIHRIINSFITTSIKDSASTTTEFSPKSLLTERETEVTGLLAEGLSYIEIADQMHISINTLKTYIKSIYRKLEIHNKVGAIIKAKELNLI